MPKYRKKKNQLKGKGIKNSNNKQLSQNQKQQNNPENCHSNEKHNEIENNVDNSALTTIVTDSGCIPEEYKQNENYVDRKEIDHVKKNLNTTNVNVLAGCSNNDDNEESEIYICKSNDNNDDTQINSAMRTSESSESIISNFSHITDSYEVNKSLNVYTSLSGVSTIDKTGAKNSIIEKGEEPSSLIEQSSDQYNQQSLNNTLKNVDESKGTNNNGAETNSNPEPSSSFISTSSASSSSSSSDSDTLKPSDADSPDREILLTVGMMPLIDDNNKKCTDNDVITHVNTNNLPICDNKKAARAITFDNSENRIGEVDSCYNYEYQENESKKSFEGPVKYPIIKEVIAVSYPYRVESPKPLKPETGNANKIKKSRSLDDDEVVIQEMSDNSSAGDLTDNNQPVVSEAESEIDTEINDTSSSVSVIKKDNKNLTILSIQTLPLESNNKEISLLEEQINMETSNNNQENDDFKLRRAKKRAALESHFLPQFLNPRYLDSIKEEGSDLSDVERKSDSGDRKSLIDISQTLSDLEDDVFTTDNDTSVITKANAIFPKSNLDFSQKKKHTSNLRAPKTGVIREESPCYVFEAKIIEQTVPIDENCFIWSTETIAQSDAAEIIYLDSASSSSSDIMDLDNTGADDADIEDLNDDSDVRIATPNIDIDDGEKRIFRKSETPTITTDESISTNSLTEESEFSDDAIVRNENRPPVELKTNATENIFNDNNYYSQHHQQHQHHKIINENEYSTGGDNDQHHDHQFNNHHSKKIIDQNLIIESDIISAVIKNCLQNNNLHKKFNENIREDLNTYENNHIHVTSPQLPPSSSSSSSSLFSSKTSENNFNKKSFLVSGNESDRKYMSSKLCENFKNENNNDDDNDDNVVVVYDEKLFMNKKNINDLVTENELRLFKIKDIANKCIDEIINECEYKVNNTIKCDIKENSSVIKNNKNNNNNNQCNLMKIIIPNDNLTEISSYISVNESTTSSPFITTKTTKNYVLNNNNNLKSEVHLNKNCDYNNLEQSSSSSLSSSTSSSSSSKSATILNCNKILTTDLDAIETEHRQIENKKLVEQFFIKNENKKFNDNNNIDDLNSNQLFKNNNNNNNTDIFPLINDKQNLKDNRISYIFQNLSTVFPIDHQKIPLIPNEMSEISHLESNLNDTLDSIISSSSDKFPINLIDIDNNNQISNLTENNLNLNNSNNNTNNNNNNNHNNNNTIEYDRQDSSGSHCSDNSHSTDHSQCTAINCGSSSNIDLDIGKYVSETSQHFDLKGTGNYYIETTATIKTLRQLCVEKLISMPYGNVILEELALVAESLSDLTLKHQKEKLIQNNINNNNNNHKSLSSEMPYPLPELPKIHDIEVSIPINENRKIRLSSIPPDKLRSPPPPPIPEPPKLNDTWFGVPTHEDPKILVCFSPSQRNYLEEKKITKINNDENENIADNLLDMHKKFIERRGYHELTAQQVDVIHREKSQKNYEKNIVSSNTHLRNGINNNNNNITLSTSSISSHLNSQQQQQQQRPLPPPPPPPLPRSFSLYNNNNNNNENEIAVNVKNNDKNNHRLLAIIRDSKQPLNSESISQKDIEQTVVNLQSEIKKIKDNYYRCDQETQTIVPNKNNNNNNTVPLGKSEEGKILEQQKITSTSSSTKEIEKSNLTNKNDENIEMNIAGEEYFKFGDGDIFNKDKKRFSNIENFQNFSSQMRQNLPKRYSNIETSSYETKKRIENGNVVYEFSDSSKQKIVDGDNSNNNMNLEKGQQTSSQNDNDKNSHNVHIMSDINLDTKLRPKEATAPITKSELDLSSQIFKNSKTTEIKNEKTSTTESTGEQLTSFEEFRQRAKESAKKAQNEFFDRENFFKGFDDISKYFGDYYTDKKSTTTTTTKSAAPTPTKNNVNETQTQNETSKTHTIPIIIENNNVNSSNDSKKIEIEVNQEKESKNMKKDEKIYEIPVIVEGKNYIHSDKSIPKKAISELNIHHIPIILEDGNKIIKSNKINNKFQRTQSLSQDQPEKYFSSHNLDDWMNFKSSYAASSENITKPFQKEVEILYKGRPSNIKAPRLSVSTSNLSSVDSKKNDYYNYYYRPSSRIDHYNLSSSQSSIDQTPITCYVNPHFPKRSSLPREIQNDQHMDYIKMKEIEIQAEFDKLENERRRLIEELDSMRSTPQFQQQSSSMLRKDILHHRSCKLPTLSEEEAFRQQMHDEWLNKVAEREERRLHKIIKISKPGDDFITEQQQQQQQQQQQHHQQQQQKQQEHDNEKFKKLSKIDIGDEFLKRVKERRSKLHMPSDSDWESGAESQPQPSNINYNDDDDINKKFEIITKNVKIIEGQKVADLKQLPKHLREFAEFTTSTTTTKTTSFEKDKKNIFNNINEIKDNKNEHFTSIINNDESSETMSKVITSTKTAASSENNQQKQQQQQNPEENEQQNEYKSNNNNEKTLLQSASTTTSSATATAASSSSPSSSSSSSYFSTNNVDNNNVNQEQQQQQQHHHQQQRQQQYFKDQQKNNNINNNNESTTTILRNNNNNNCKKTTQSTQTTITTTRKKQTKYILSPNRRSWSESDLLKEIDKELILSKGFLFGHESQPVMFAPKFKAKAPTGTGIWSPTNKPSETSVTESSQQYHHQQQQQQQQQYQKKPLSTTNQCPTPPPLPSQPIWSPQPSPTPGRKEFRPVKFESPNLPRRYVRQDSAPSVAPPWSYTNSKPFLGYQSTSTSCTNLNTPDICNETNLFKTKINSNSTNSLIQRTKESLFGKGSSYTETERQKIPKNDAPPILRPNEVVYSVKHEYMSEPESEYDKPKKMAQLGRRQYDGIGPTTKDGMPIVLRSEVKENNQHKWYKRMYNTLHKAKDHDDYVTIRYKTRRGRYPYKSNGYMSEPEPNYDSDYSTMKYHTLEKSRYTPSSGTTAYHDDRNYGTMPNPIKSGSPSYKNQPGRIEDYVPGHSSVSEKERKEWWDEVMEIFNGQLDQQKLSNSYTEGYLSRALKEQGYESDSNLIFRKKQDSQISPLSPVEQKQAYKSVQAGGEPPLQGFRKPAPEKPRDDNEIEYFPITSTLTKIRVHNMKALSQPQKEIICYPITNISRPLDLFAPFPKNVPSFIPINPSPLSSSTILLNPPPPPPPNRNSSRTTSTALKVINSHIKKNKKFSTGTVGRHEACFQTDYYHHRDISIPANKYGTITIRKHNKHEPIIRSKSAGAVPKLLTTTTTTSASSTKEESKIQKYGENSQHISRKQKSYRFSSSVSPSGGQKLLSDLRKSSPSPVAFGRSISKERTFAEEKKRLEETVPLCRRYFTASTNILKDPSLKSPDEVKKAVRSFARPLIRSKSAPKKIIPTTSYITTTTKKNSILPGKKEEKSMKLSVSVTSRGGKELHRESTLSAKALCKSPSTTKSLIHSSKITEKKSSKQLTKSSSTHSLTKTNSTFSVNSTDSKKKVHSKKPITITRSMSKEYSPLTICGKVKPTKSHSKQICTSKSESNVLKKIETEANKFLSKEEESIVKHTKNIEKEIERSLNDALMEHQETVRSDHFFRNLFLRDSSPVPSIESTIQPGSVQEKTKYWNTMSSKSEPSLRRSSFYLSQKRPVSDSRFLAIENKHFHQSRSLSPPTFRRRPYGRKITEKITKFDSFQQPSEDESEFGERTGKTEEIIYKFEQRSSSEPRTRTVLTEIIQPNSPTVIHGRRSLEYSKVISPTHDVRSPSRRRIQSFRDSQKAETKKIIRASSLSSADERSRKGLYECSEHSHSASSLNFIEGHGPYCSLRNSDKFRDLSRFYTTVERVGQLERATSSTDLRPIRKEGEIIDFDEWKKIRAHERAEKEMHYLVGKLKQDEKEKDFLYMPKDPEDVKWNEMNDSGLRCKEKSVEDLRETFEKKIYEDGFDEIKKLQMEYEKDTYKPLWRGSSVADSATSMVVKYNAPDKKQDRRICLSNRLMSTLTKDQINRIKNQLNEIYSNSTSGGIPKDKCEISEDFIITVDEQNKSKLNTLKVRCNSSITKEELLGPVLKRKEAQLSTTKSESTSSVPSYPLPPRPPIQSKTFERISKQVSSNYETELSEGEKKRLSQTLSREIQDKVFEKKKRTTSPVARETFGAVATENAKKSFPENVQPQTKQFYSMEYSHVQTENSKDKSAEKRSEKKIIKARRSSVGESESNASDISKSTVIYKENPTEGMIKTKIKYFEEKKEEEPPKTIYHAREYSSPDEEEIIKAIEEKFKAKEQETRQKFTLKHKELSSSLSDLKEIFGEKQLSRINFPVPLPPPPPDEIIEPSSTNRHRSSSLTLSDASRSIESLYRSRSISPIVGLHKPCLSRMRTGDVKKIKNKFENLNDKYKQNFFELCPLRKIHSDPELNKVTSKHNQHKVTIKDHEVGDVSWITHKFEIRNNVANRGRSRTRKVISPIPKNPLRREDRLMPHIDIISKTASLKAEMIKSSHSPSPTQLQQPLHTGEVERIRCKFESPERTSLLGQMYTSSPDISELKNISTYLSADWIAHKFPNPRDNARSPTSPQRGPECEHVKRRIIHRPSSTSPPRSKSILTSILKPYYDIFADQKFDPLIHRPKARYVPDHINEVWKKVPNGYKKPSAVKFEESDVVPPPPPPPNSKGIFLNENGQNSESSRRYIEGDVNIHYKTPIRYEYKESIPDEELARRQAETMKKLYQEERRRKYLQELQDMNKRRHTDNFIPSQKSPIPLNRYDDFITDITPKSPNTTIHPKTVARALYNFQGQTARELTFKKGDVIYIRRQIDKNWYEGEHNAMVGLLPANYVEIITKDGVRQPPKKPSEGQARAKFNFSAQSAIELSLNKGELVTLTRRVDENWFEGRIANRKGIFPVSYVEVLTDIGSEDNIQSQPIQSKPVGSPASHSLITYPNATSLDTLRTNINNEFNNLTNGHPANKILRETKSIHKTEVLHVDTNSEPIPYRALYKYRPQNNDELELHEGDIVYVLEKCDDGWYVGTSQRTGYFGTFPGNYVEKI